MNRIRLLLADDHVMFSEGLRSLLRDEFELLGTVTTGKELVESTLTLKPEVILVDISMPVLNGFDAVREIRKRGSEAKVIFLTMHDDAMLVGEALRCGASGYILKQSAGEELVNAIREVAQGNNYISPLITNLPSESQTKQVQKTITPRQREVMKLICQGLTMREVAAELKISTRTAETHKYEIMQTLGVETTAELIRYCLRLGLVS